VAAIGALVEVLIGRSTCVGVERVIDVASQLARGQMAVVHGTLRRENGRLVHDDLAMAAFMEMSRMKAIDLRHCA